MKPAIKPEVARWGRREWLDIFKCFLLGAPNKGQFADKLSQIISTQYPQSTHFILNSARGGLIVALGLFKKNKPQKFEVIIPEFICDSVPQTVVKCGLTPVFSPVTSDLNLDVSQLVSLCNEHTLAVILPHMYGKAADIVKAETYLKDKGIYLIDDAAQVAGINVNGCPLGTFGDVGLLSFAQAKTIVTGVRGSGGVLFVNNESLVEPLQLQLKNLSYSTSRFSAFLHFLFSYKWQGNWQKVDYYLQRLAAKTSHHKVRNYYEPISRISNFEAGIASNQFISLAERIACMKRNVSFYHEQRLPTSITFPQLNEELPYLTRMILQSKRITPDMLGKRLSFHGIATKKVYGDGSKEFDGSVTSGLLELPLQSLNRIQIEQICQLINQIHTEYENITDN